MTPAAWLSCWLLLGTPEAAAAPSPATPSPSAAHELVVLVHGMGRTRRSMLPVQRALEQAGYEVLNHGYPSRRATVAESGQALAERIAAVERRPDIARVHMVGHSLGNIVIRWVIAYQRPSKLGRIVMLAPPNQGAHLADEFAPWLSWLSRPLPELTTRPGSAARAIPTPDDVEIGVIAGSYDYTVRPPETCLAGQRDHILVPSGHTFIMRKRQVQRLTKRFIRRGAFAEEAQASRPCPCP